MKKIALLIDALNVKPETLDFAAYIAKLGKSKIVGVFIEEYQLDIHPTIKSFGGPVYVEEVTLSAEERKENEVEISKNIDLFKEGCAQREVSAIVHHHKGNALKNAIHETRYADLVIIDPAISFTNDTNIPSKFAIALFSHAECPILIAPEYFEQINEVVLTYNGSRSSVFAIKQFYYQLPELGDKKIIILQINETDHTDGHKDEKAQFKEWLEMHFSKISFLEITGDAREELFKYFMEHNESNNKLLVTGAFGRTALSSFFKRSTADLVLKAVDIPIFITHH